LQPGELVAPGMSDHRNAAGTDNPVYGFSQRRPAMRDIPRFSRHQIRLKHVADVLADADFHQISREMRAADQARILRIPHRPVEAVSDADFLEFRRHAPGAVDPPGADPCQPGVQRFVPRIEIEPDDVHLKPPPFDGNFHAIDKTHRRLLRDGPCSSQPAEIVVIGKREQFDTVCRGAPSHLGRREQAVGGSGMGMKVGDKHGWRDDPGKIKRTMIAHEPLHRPP